MIRPSGRLPLIQGRRLKQAITQKATAYLYTSETDKSLYFLR